MNSLENVYSRGKVYSSGNAYSNGGFSSSSGYAEVHADWRVQAVINQFNDEVKQNIIHPYGKQKGSIALRMVYHSNIDKGIGWYWASMLTLCTVGFGGLPFLFGAPFEHYVSDAKLEVDIYDKEHNLLGSYIGSGHEKAFVAFYWGYGLSDAESKSFYNSLIEGFNEIKDKINADNKRLVAELSK